MPGVVTMEILRLIDVDMHIAYPLGFLSVSDIHLISYLCLLSVVKAFVANKRHPFFSEIMLGTGIGIDIY